MEQDKTIVKSNTDKFGFDKMLSGLEEYVQTNCVFENSYYINNLNLCKRPKQKVYELSGGFAFAIPEDSAERKEDFIFVSEFVRFSIDKYGNKKEECRNLGAKIKENKNKTELVNKSYDELRKELNILYPIGENIEGCQKLVESLLEANNHSVEKWRKMVGIDEVKYLNGYYLSYLD